MIISLAQKRNVPTYYFTYYLLKKPILARNLNLAQYVSDAVTADFPSVNLA